MKRVHVAVGVILNSKDQILIARRPSNLHQGGKWEFPGGKVEAGETVTQALIRELDEEVGLKVLDTSPFMAISHDYEDKNVLLDIHLVTDFNGVAKGLENQPLVWVEREELTDYTFPEANLPIIEKLQQPA